MGIVFAWPGFGGGGYRGCCEKLPEPPPCPTEPIPAGFRNGPTLARAEPIGNGQHRPGKRFKKEKNYSANVTVLGEE